MVPPWLKQARPISGLAASCWGVLETIGISSSFANLFFGSTNPARERPAFVPANPPAAPVWQTQPQQLGCSPGSSQNSKTPWFTSLSSSSPLNLPFWGIWYPLFWDNPWSSSDRCSDALQSFCKASRGRSCIAGALCWPLRALERHGG